MVAAVLQQKQVTQRAAEAVVAAAMVVVLQVVQRLELDCSVAGAPKPWAAQINGRTKPAWPVKLHV